VRSFAPHTLIGIAAAVAVSRFIPANFYWFVPLLAGAALSIPLALVTSSVWFGGLARRAGLFLVPSETVGLQLLERS
jgi:membrane glycosyltransferase